MQFSELLKKGFVFTSRQAKLTPQDIVTLERMIDAPLPEQYREYLLYANGGGVKRTGEQSDDGYVATIIWPAGNGLFPNEEPVSLNNFFRHDESLKEGDLLYTETLEYNFTFWREFLPEYTLPIACDPGGGLFLIGFGKNNNGKITYWRRVLVNQLDQQDALSRAFEGRVAESFVEFILSMTPL